MALTTSGSITFRIANENWPMHIPRAVSLEALNTFAHAIAAYTNAAIVSVSFSTEETIADIPGNPLGGGFDYIAGLLLHGQTTKSKNLAIPAPVAEMFETVSGEGLKVKQIHGDALATLYSALVGETFTFVRGRLS